LEVGYFVSVVAQANGQPLSGVAVTLKNAYGTVIYSGATNASGQIDDIPVVSTMYQQENSNCNQIVTIGFGSFLATATWNKASGRLTFNLSQDVTINVSPSGGTLSMTLANGNPGGNVQMNLPHAQTVGGDAVTHAKPAARIDTSILSKWLAPRLAIRRPRGPEIDDFFADQSEWLSMIFSGKGSLEEHDPKRR
jgi:hypothetical protein